MPDGRKLNVPVPERYWTNPGQEPTLKWSQWLNQPEDFFHLTDIGLADDAKLKNPEKNRYLRTLLGSEGLRQFSTHPTCENVDTVTFAEYAGAAKSVFMKSTNTIRAHYEFNVRKQGGTETVQEYVIALRTIMADCEFFGHEKHFLAVQLATGVHNKETQTKLLAQPQIDLEAFMRIAEADESSSLDSKILRNEDRPVIAAARKPRPKFTARKTIDRMQKAQQKGGAHPNAGAKERRCYGCGGTGHVFGSKDCPAMGKQCDGCGVMNHFRKVCVKTHGKGIRFLEVEDSDDAVRSVDCRKAKKSFRCKIDINDQHGSDHTIEAEVDSCSDISGITHTIYTNHFSGNNLIPAQTTVRNFDRSVISGIQGYFQAGVRYKGRQAKVNLYVFPDNFGTVFGKDIIEGLQLILDGDDMQVKAVENGAASKYTDMVRKYPNITRDDLGTFPDYKHSIKLRPDAVPCMKRSRPIPLERRDKAMAEIKEMERLGIWSKVERSDWVHPMVAVDKPDGSVRITTNLIGLNKYVIPFQFPIPNIKEMFLELTKAKVFSKLDFKKAYFQILLEEDCRLLTTTDTPLGLYAYNRLVMGLSDSAQAFQYSILLTFSPVPRNLAYIDDDLVHGETVEEHDETLDRVLARANEKDLRINVNKCKFGVTEVEFLGHVISPGAIRPHPKNIQPIKDYAEPTNVKEVQRFLGMVNYYGSFIPDLATAAEPLRRLTRKSVPFEWDERCQAAFSTLKEAVSTTVELAVFDITCATIVTTDASDVGIGGVLSQVQGGKEVPIAFGHHTLDSSQRNYAAHEREAYAVLFFCEYWDMFLLGRQFVVRTDHQSLQTLLQGKTERQSKKFARWLERLEPFSFTVEYTKGKDNTVADALSRATLSPPQDSECIRALSSQGITVSAVATATQSDPLYSRLAKMVQSGSWPGKVATDGDLRRYYIVKDELAVEQGCLIRKGYQVLLPASLRKEVLQRAHEAHPGVVRMKRKLRECYWWPSINDDVERIVKFCNACQASAKSAPKAQQPTDGKIPLPDKPWQKLAIDIAGPYATAPMNQRFVVVLIDYYSKYPEVYCTGDTTSAKLIKWLKTVFAQHGMPSIIVSDNGPQFTSGEFEGFLSENDIRHYKTPIYNPERNGLVEGFNRHIKHHIQTFQTARVTWDEGLQNVLMHYRATPLQAGGKSPSELLNGRKMRLGYEVNWYHSKSAKDEEQRQKHTEEEREVPKHGSDHLQNRGPYKVGQEVRIRLQAVPKGKSPYSEPRKVSQVLGNYTYRLNDGSVVNAKMLRPVYKEDDQADQNNPNPEGQNDQPRRSTRPNKGVPPTRFQA